MCMYVYIYIYTYICIYIYICRRACGVGAHRVVVVGAVVGAVVSPW